VSFIPVAAKAADNAERGFALFSADGQYFAFEQFGIQDGSGFPYSTIAVVDLDRDRWVDGTPVTVRPETEEATLARTRADAAVRVKPVLDRLHINTPGETLASNPATEIVPDRKTLTFAPYYQGIGLDSATHRPPQSARYTLSLTDIPFPLREPCYGEEKAQYGFVLTVRDHDTKASKEAYRDRTIPASRYCPLGYDLADIFVFRKFGAPERYVALIGVYTPGFEGLDRRLIAVPIALP
jgi:predicted secreted protein